MKANNGKGNIVERDEWETPKELFDKLHKQYWFDFDCCSTEENTKCGWYSDDLKKCEYAGSRSWMNPPFSKAYKMFECFFKIIKSGVAIYRCDNMETKIWQDIIFKKASWIFIPDRRVSYDGLDGDGARFPSALIGFNVDPPKGLDGTTLEVKH